MMKGRKGKVEDFQVALTAEALQVIEQAKAWEQNGNLFASKTGRTVLSDVALSKYMRETRGLPYKLHGFRATLRTWLEEQTEVAFEVREAVLAHKEANRTEQNRTEQSGPTSARTTLMNAEQCRNSGLHSAWANRKQPITAHSSL